MGAVWMRLGAELRERWRAWLGVALLAGIFGGAVVAAASGAARTGSVVDRHLEKLRPPDVFFVPLFGIQESGPEILEALRFENLIELRSVADGAHAFILPGPDGVEVLASDDPRFGYEIFRPRLLEGHLPDPARPDEAVADVLAAEEFGLHPGDTYTVEFAEKFQLPGDQEEPPPGPTVRLRITGITASLGNFAAIAEPGFNLTPAFLERYGDDIEGIDFSMLRLRQGTRSSGEFRKEIERLTKGETVFYTEAGIWEEARSSFGLQAASLWILAGLLAFVTILVLGQTIARQTFLESAEHPVLRALGLSRTQLFALGALRAAALGVAGAAGAVVVAAAASPLAPFGTARLADPDPAFSVPTVPTLLGFAGVFAAVVALGLFPSWRAARVATTVIGPAEVRPGAQPARVAEAFSRSVRGPAAGVGVRMALEPGRGRTAVPVRTTISATAVALVALVAALVVGSSLGHLTATPRLYGWNWDLAVVSNCFNEHPELPCPTAGEQARAKLESIDGIAQASFGPDGGILLVDGFPVDPYGLELGADVHPPILEGRAPERGDEVLLARKTLRAVDKRIGDIVQIGFQGASVQTPFRIVGVTVLPVASDVSTLGEGAWLPFEELARIFGQEIPTDRALVRFAPGADRKAVTDEIVNRLQPEIQRAAAPGTVVDFGRVANMPWVLAGIVALLAAGTLAHGLVTAVRRRGRDLAILKSLGLDPGQVRRAVAWQASAIAVVTLAVGIPFGFIVGRWIWTLLADETGFLAEPVIQPAVLLATIPAAILVANLIAALPARIAARTVPAVVLRTE